MARAAVEIVAERDDRDADHRRQHFAAVVRSRQRARHHAEPEAANAEGHHITVAEYAGNQRHQRETDRDGEADLVEEMVFEEHPADRGDRREEDRRRKAMDEAEPRQAHRKLVARQRGQRSRIARSPHHRAEARPCMAVTGDLGHPILRWSDCGAGYGIT